MGADVAEMELALQEEERGEIAGTDVNACRRVIRSEHQCGDLIATNALQALLEVGLRGNGANCDCAHDQRYARLKPLLVDDAATNGEDDACEQWRQLMQNTLPACLVSSK